MKIQLGEVRIILDSLGSFLKERIPAKTAYWFSRTITQLQPEYKAYEEGRMNLAKKYCKLDKAGELALDKDNQFQFLNDETQTSFMKELIELGKEEVEIKLDSLSIDQLGEIDISTETMLGLQPLFNEEE